MKFRSMRGPVFASVLGLAAAFTTSMAITAAEPAVKTPTSVAKAADAPLTADKEEKDSQRLPPHFGKIVSDKQRDKIYAIQAKHEKAIEELKEELRLAVSARDAEIRAVLLPEQIKELEAALAAAKAERKAKAAEDAATEKKTTAPTK